MDRADPQIAPNMFIGSIFKKFKSIVFFVIDYSFLG